MRMWVMAEWAGTSVKIHPTILLKHVRFTYVQIKKWSGEGLIFLLYLTMLKIDYFVQTLITISFGIYSQATRYI